MFNFYINSIDKLIHDYRNKLNCFRRVYGNIVRFLLGDQLMAVSQIFRGEK